MNGKSSTIHHAAQQMPINTLMPIGPGVFSTAKINGKRDVLRSLYRIFPDIATGRNERGIQKGKDKPALAQKGELLLCAVSNIAKFKTHQLCLGTEAEGVEARTQIDGDGDFTREEIAYGKGGLAAAAISPGEHPQWFLAYAFGREGMVMRLLERYGSIGNSQKKRLETRRGRLMPYVEMNVWVLDRKGLIPVLIEKGTSLMQVRNVKTKVSIG